MDELNPTARAILGILSFGPRSGYDIKSLVDDSTRFFWTASYASIYPELKRLRGAGLVTATDDPAGGRRRTVFDLTDAGREQLGVWLRSDAPLTYEIRDEGLLKLFFASQLAPDEAREAVRRMRARHEQVLVRLQALRDKPGGHTDPRAFTGRVLAYGLALHEFTTDWLERLERELADETKE